MKKKTSNTNLSKSSHKTIAQKTNPVVHKDPARRGGSVSELTEPDKEEFQNRKKISKKVAETQKQQANSSKDRRSERISDSGMRDDDDDGEVLQPAKKSKLDPKTGKVWKCKFKK